MKRPSAPKTPEQRERDREERAMGALPIDGSAIPRWEMQGSPSLATLDRLKRRMHVAEQKPDHWRFTSWTLTSIAKEVGRDAAPNSRADKVSRAMFRVIEARSALIEARIELVQALGGGPSDTTLRELERLIARSTRIDGADTLPGSTTETTTTKR